MRKKLFWNMLVLSFISIIVTSIASIYVIYSTYISDIKQEVKSNCSYIQLYINENGNENVETIAKLRIDNRITIIKADGSVFYDSRTSDKLENHSERPEFISALRYGEGEEIRHSDTLNKDTFYYAVKLKDGNILRVSSSVESIITTYIKGIPIIFAILMFFLVVTIFVANKKTRDIVNPLNNLDLDNPLSNDTFDELSGLLHRLEMQNQEISTHIKHLESNKREFDSITENMQEGLVVFNSSGEVLSINSTANNIFRTKFNVGKNYIYISRENEYKKVVEKALNGEQAIENFTTDSKTYQLSASPILNGDSLTGVVLLVTDISEKVNAEKMRREFTANVSHELKTPLTSISGYAEIIQNGIARPEDVGEFAGKIVNQSQRLLYLIEDIIKLSKLDEKNSDSITSVDLLKICNETVENLHFKAEKNNVDMILEGEKVVVTGYEHLLSEMIYNLCDNAIRYRKTNSKENSYVKIKLKKENDNAIIVISDNGIGISKEHQERVFERFYRVDKSHSKLTGGTGLGLSIVKSAVKYHNGKIKLDSEIGVGSTFTITIKAE